MDSNKIGLYLTELRKRKGLTQIQLAEMLNVSHQAVSKWETGESIPDVNMLVALSKIHDVSVDEILNGVIPKEEKSNPINNNQSQNLFPILRILLSFIMLLSFFFPFYKETLETSTFFGNTNITFVASGFEVLFYSNGLSFLFFGTLILFLGTLTLLSMSIIQLLDSTNSTRLLKNISQVDLKTIKIIIYGTLMLGALIVVFSYFQIGGIIILLFLISYIFIDLKVDPKIEI